MMIRTFIAFELSEALKKCCLEMAAQGQGLGDGIRWTGAEQLHLSAKFLGDTAQKLVPRIEQMLSEIAEITPAITLSFSQLGCFPLKGAPAIFWLGSDNTPTSLAQFIFELEARSVKLGFRREEREYRPHITLARIKGRLPSMSREKLLQLEYAAQEERLQSVTLFRSHLTAQGARYEILARLPFKRGAAA